MPKTKLSTRAQKLYDQLLVLEEEVKLLPDFEMKKHTLYSVGGALQGLYGIKSNLKSSGN